MVPHGRLLRTRESPRYFKHTHKHEKESLTITDRVGQKLSPGSVRSCLFKRGSAAVVAVLLDAEVFPAGVHGAAA